MSSLNVTTAGGAINGTAVRSNGTDGAVTVNWQASGAGCVAASGSQSFAAGSSAASPGSFSVTGSSTGGICTVAITPSAGTLGATSSVNITYAGTVAVDLTQCPTGYQAPGNLLTANFLGLGQWWAQKNKSGQVVSIALPAVASGRYSGQAAFGENIGAAYTPQPVTLEITISKCQGYIDVDAGNPTNTHPNNNYCNLKSPNGTYNQITWFAKAYSTLTDATSANRYGYCWAPEGGSTYYLNARWTYSSCPYGQSACGFAIQQNLGPY